jgi:MFS family permease
VTAAAPARTPAAPKDGLVERHLRRNVVTLGLDFGLFLIGLSFASSSTILPAFVASLGAPNLVVGAIPAVMTAGWYLPALFAAGHTGALARKLPFILRYTLWERVPLLGLAGVAFFLAGPVPMLAQVLVLLMLLVMTGIGGLLMPAWMDLVGRAIPTRLRGRFFAGASLLGSGGGLLGTAATVAILRSVPGPAGYGVCFLVSALFMGLSFAALVAVREPPPGTLAPAVALGAYLRRIPGLLRRDANLAWFVAARAAAAFGMMASAFYAVYALAGLRAGDWMVGVFTTALLAGQTVGQLGFGWLADHVGHRIVITIGIGATVAANALALTASSLDLFLLVFALSGVQLAAINVSWLTILLEFAPSAQDRPTYLGIGNTFLAPAMAAAPLLAGLMADTIGFLPIFVVALACGLVALAILALKVRDPRA